MPSKQKRSRKKSLTAIDLFSGCGGLSLGLQRAGFDVRAAVEIDEKATETYRLNHAGVKMYGRDVRRLTVKSVMKDLRLTVGELDLLAGCPPCQGFSRLRTRNKTNSVDDPRNDLIADFLRFVRVLKPKTVMLENVPGLAEDERFKKLCRELERLGYKYVVQKLNAADYLVPQRRTRLILLASRIHAPKIAPTSDNRVSVRTALKGLKGISSTNDQLHSMPESRSDDVKAIISLIPHNGGSRSDLPLKYRLDCHKKSDGFHDVYGRMAWDTVAPTITSGCTNPSKGRFLHPTRNRTITLREAAILQGFPRGYKFNVSHGKGAIALMIGNALPPAFIAAHARVLAKGIIANRDQR